MLAGRDLSFLRLEERRELLQRKVLSKMADPIRFSPALNASLNDLIRSVREQRLEGLIAKRRDSRYEPGQRTGV
jgi:bifunctional non-homologous end joining protein LigD